MRQNDFLRGGFVSTSLIFPMLLAFAIPLMLSYLATQVDSQNSINNFQSRVIGFQDALRTMLSVRPTSGDGFCKTQISQFSTDTFSLANLGSIEINIPQFVNGSGVPILSSSQSFNGFRLIEAKIKDFEVILDKRIYLGNLMYFVRSENFIHNNINTSSRKIPLIIYTSEVGSGQVEINDCQASLFNSASQFQNYVVSGCQTLGASLKDNKCSFLFSYLGSSCSGGQILEGFNSDGTLKCKSL